MNRPLTRFLGVLLCVLLAGRVAWAGENDAHRERHASDDTYNQQEMLHDANQFFGQGAAGIAKVIEKAFREKGRPNAYITGDEESGAIGIGVRYGNGILHMKNGASRKVYWQGPSIGFDLGANASKVFVLVYHLPNVQTIFQRFPGVSGSLYFVAGVGINYAQSGNVILAPIRLGVGWRQGANVGYMHFTRKKSWNPF